MNTTNKTYNGWKNWQTWNVALWLGNDEGLYRAAIEAREAMKRDGYRGFNAERARDWVMDALPKGTRDMSKGAKEYRGVDWSAISRAMNEF